MGIATECVPDAELEKATDKLVDELRTFFAAGQRTAKKLLNDTEDSTLGPSRSSSRAIVTAGCVNRRISRKASRLSTPSVPRSSRDYSDAGLGPAHTIYRRSGWSGRPVARLPSCKNQEKRGFRNDNHRHALVDAQAPAAIDK